MNNEYTEFVKAIELSSITLVESHEKVIFTPSDVQLDKIKIDTEHGYNKDDPIIQDSSLLNLLSPVSKKPPHHLLKKYCPLRLQVPFLKKIIGFEALYMLQ